MLALFGNFKYFIKKIIEGYNALFKSISVLITVYDYIIKLQHQLFSYAITKNCRLDSFNSKSRFVTLNERGG